MTFVHTCCAKNSSQLIAIAIWVRHDDEWYKAPPMLEWGPLH